VARWRRWLSGALLSLELVVELIARIYGVETVTCRANPITLDTPENCAETIVDLCLPGYAETDTLYNYRVKKFLNWTPPGSRHVILSEK
jgi:hypothetical protein